MILTADLLIESSFVGDTFSWVSIIIYLLSLIMDLQIASSFVFSWVSIIIYLLSLIMDLLIESSFVGDTFSWVSIKSP